jgi:hypothetical protein
MKLNQLRKLIREEISKTMNEVNQPYKVISKKTETSPYRDEEYDNYELDVKDEMYTTPDGSTFQIKITGYASTNKKGEELDFNNPYHFFYYMDARIFDENGKQLEKMPGSSHGITFKLTPTLRKVKNWLNKNGARLLSGERRYQWKDS